MGVGWRDDRSCWVASFTINGKRVYRHFDEFDDAVRAREAWELQYTGTTASRLKAA
jgi:hypothetical protein